MPRITETFEVFYQLYRIFPSLPPHIKSLDLHLDFQGNPPTLKVEFYPTLESGEVDFRETEVKVFDIIERKSEQETPQLNDAQKRILDGAHIENIKAIIDDLESPENTMSLALFGLGMSPEFMKPNATPEVVLAYCRESLRRREQEPEDVFSESQLRSWVESNGFIEVDNP